jgi:hypothetical protein
VIGQGATGNGTNTATIGTGGIPLYIPSGLMTMGKNSTTNCILNMYNISGNFFNIKSAGSGASSFFYILYNDSSGVQLTNSAPNSWTSASDSRLKTNITQIESSLSSLLQLNPITFDFTEHISTRKSMGFIAQEVGQIPLFSYLPMSMGKQASDGTDYLGLSYTDFIPYLVKGIQEQNVIIQQQATEITALQTQLAQVLQRLSAAGIA